MHENPQPLHKPGPSFTPNAPAPNFPKQAIVVTDENSYNHPKLERGARDVGPDILPHLSLAGQIKGSQEFLGEKKEVVKGERDVVVDHPRGPIIGSTVTSGDRNHLATSTLTSQPINNIIKPSRRPLEVADIAAAVPLLSLKDLGSITGQDRLREPEPSHRSDQQFVKRAICPAANNNFVRMMEVGGGKKTEKIVDPLKNGQLTKARNVMEVERESKEDLKHILPSIQIDPKRIKTPEKSRSDIARLPSLFECGLAAQVPRSNINLGGHYQHSSSMSPSASTSQQASKSGESFSRVPQFRSSESSVRSNATSIDMRRRPSELENDSSSSSTSDNSSALLEASKTLESLSRSSTMPTIEMITNASAASSKEIPRLPNSVSSTMTVPTHLPSSIQNPLPHQQQQIVVPLASVANMPNPMTTHYQNAGLLQPIQYFHIAQPSQSPIPIQIPQGHILVAANGQLLVPQAFIPQQQYLNPPIYHHPSQVIQDGSMKGTGGKASNHAFPNGQNLDVVDQNFNTNAPSPARSLSAAQNRFGCRHAGCTKAFPSRSRLQRHMIVHTGEKPFVCEFSGCDRTFSRRDNMMQHYRTHFGRSSKINTSPTADRRAEMFMDSASLVLAKALSDSEDTGLGILEDRRMTGSKRRKSMVG